MYVTIVRCLPTQLVEEIGETESVGTANRNLASCFLACLSLQPRS
jgi:hypothetical protein